MRRRRSVAEFEQGLLARIEAEQKMLTTLEAEAADQQELIRRQRIRLETLESVAKELAEMGADDERTGQV